MITATVKTDRVIERFNRLPEDMRNSLAHKMPEIGQYLANYVVQSKLDGQVLHVRSGNLRRSIAQQTDAEGSAVRTRVGVMSGPALAYAAIHEYGATFTRSVFWGRQGLPRTVVYPERSYLRTSLADQRQAIAQKIREAVKVS